MGEDQVKAYEEFFENDETPDVSDFALPQVSGPESSWRWRVACKYFHSILGGRPFDVLTKLRQGLHLIVPQDLNNFTNRYLKLDDTCARLITLVLGVGPERFSETLGDDEGANSMAQIEHEASAVPDHNSGFPLRLSNGIRKLLDGGAILGAPRLGVCT